MLTLSVGLIIVPVIDYQQARYEYIQTNLYNFQTLKQEDILLLQWITQNVKTKESILVSMGDSGQYVTSVTQKPSVFFYSYLTNYSVPLMEYLTSNASDLRAVPFLVEYNVSYVYIGSYTMSESSDLPYYRHFNASQFLAAPYFNLAKEFGSAYLFQFNASAALAKYYAYN